MPSARAAAKRIVGVASEAVWMGAVPGAVWALGAWDAKLALAPVHRVFLSPP